MAQKVLLNKKQSTPSVTDLKKVDVLYENKKGIIDLRPF